MKQYGSLVIALVVAATLCGLAQSPGRAEASIFIGTHLLEIHFDDGEVLRTLLILTEEVGKAKKLLRGHFVLFGELFQVQAAYPDPPTDLAHLVAMGPGPTRIVALKVVEEDATGLPISAMGPCMIVGPGFNGEGAEKCMMHITYFVDRLPE